MFPFCYHLASNAIHDMIFIAPVMDKIAERLFNNPHPGITHVKNFPACSSGCIAMFSIFKIGTSTVCNFVNPIIPLTYLTLPLVIKIKKIYDA